METRTTSATLVASTRTLAHGTLRGAAPARIGPLETRSRGGARQDALAQFLSNRLFVL